MNYCNDKKVMCDHATETQKCPLAKCQYSNQDENRLFELIRSVDKWYHGEFTDEAFDKVLASRLYQAGYKLYENNK